MEIINQGMTFQKSHSFSATSNQVSRFVIRPVDNGDWVVKLGEVWYGTRDEMKFICFRKGAKELELKGMLQLKVRFMNLGSRIRMTGIKI